eukprot:1136222-Pelagomonas_calceolata.AAC.5
MPNPLLLFLLHLPPTPPPSPPARTMYKAWATVGGGTAATWRSMQECSTSSRTLSRSISLLSARTMTNFMVSGARSEEGFGQNAPGPN